jgi:hypothetical protein
LIKNYNNKKIDVDVLGLCTFDVQFEIRVLFFLDSIRMMISEEGTGQQLLQVQLLNPAGYCSKLYNNQSCNCVILIWRICYLLFFVVVESLYLTNRLLCSPTRKPNNVTQTEGGTNKDTDKHQNETI